MKTVEEFSENYGALYDAVIKSISFVYHPSPIGLVITTVINCMALMRDDSWVYLKIDFHGSEEFNINSKDNFSFEVIENFSILELGDKFIFNFYPNTTTPETVAEHRDSMFYIIFREIDFSEINY